MKIKRTQPVSYAATINRNTLTIAAKELQPHLFVVALDIGAVVPFFGEAQFGAPVATADPGTAVIVAIEVNVKIGTTVVNMMGWVLYGQSTIVAAQLEMVMTEVAYTT